MGRGTPNVGFRRGGCGGKGNFGLDSTCLHGGLGCPHGARGEVFAWYGNPDNLYHANSIVDGMLLFFGTATGAWQQSVRGRIWRATPCLLLVACKLKIKTRNATLSNISGASKGLCWRKPFFQTRTSGAMRTDKYGGILRRVLLHTFSGGKRPALQSSRPSRISVWRTATGSIRHLKFGHGRGVAIDAMELLKNRKRHLVAVAVILTPGTRSLTLIFPTATAAYLASVLSRSPSPGVGCVAISFSGALA